MLQKISKTISQHKIITPLIILFIIGGGYFGYKAIKSNNEATRYVLAAVEKGTIIASVSGSGQVSASKEVIIKSSNSGEIIYVGVEKGQEVKEGTLIAKIDQTDALKAVQDSENNLKSAQITLEKMNGNELLRGTREKAEENLKNTYSDGFNEAVDVFSGLPTMMDGLKDINEGNAFGSFNQWNIDYIANYLQTYDSNTKQYRDNAYNAYQLAKGAYDENLDTYKATSIKSDSDKIESLINETYETLKIISETLQNDNVLYQAFRERLVSNGLTPNSLLTTYLSKIDTYITQTNNYLSALLSAKNNIQTQKENIINADYDIASQEIKVKQAEDALLNSQEKLKECSIYAPFDGIVAELNISKGEYVAEGGAVATIITKDNLVEVTLNEVDAAKVKPVQKTTLTFDAIGDLTLTGKILNIDSIGTVSQGVVSYNVEIVFDAQDEKIKPGMTATADIIINAKQDILVLPNNAIKSQGNSSYVELVEVPEEMKQQLLANVSGTILPKLPTSQIVETGLSNDTYTEIVSGLKEGDVVITSTISSNNTQSTQSVQSTRGFEMPMMEGGSPR